MDLAASSVAVPPSPWRLAPCVPRKAVELLAKLRSRGLEPNVVTYNAVIEACATAGQFERVMGLIDEMSATKDTRPTVITFSTALK